MRLLIVAALLTGGCTYKSCEYMSDAITVCYQDAGEYVEPLDCSADPAYDAVAECVGDAFWAHDCAAEGVEAAVAEACSCDPGLCP